MPSTTRHLHPGLRVLHWVIVANFALEIGYGAYMTFFVLKTGTPGPLFGAARDIPHELMVARRLYAIETWIATAGLSAYLAVTEYLPRLLAQRRED